VATKLSIRHVAPPEALARDMARKKENEQSGSAVKIET